MTKNIKISIIITILLAILGGSYFLYTKRTKEVNPSVDFANNNPIKVGLIGESAGTVEFKTADGKTAKAPALSIEAIAKIPKPDLDRQIVITEKSIAESDKVQVVNIVKGTIAEVKANPYSFDTWIKLGTQFKIIGDYKSATEMWEYVNLANPGNIASFSNLGNLYQNYLKDYVKAEYNLKRVIQNDGTYVVGYINLFNLYRYQTGSDTKATDILKEGIAKNKNAVDLYMALATYYKEKGNSDDYKKTLNEVKAIALKLGNNDLASEINKMLSSN